MPVSVTPLMMSVRRMPGSRSISSEPPDFSPFEWISRAGTSFGYTRMRNAGSTATPASSQCVGLKPQPSMEIPVSEGPKKAESEAPSAKVAKLRVRASPPPYAPIRLWIETWKKMWPRPTSAEHTMSPASPPPTIGTRIPSDSMSEPPTMGFITPMRSETFPA
jgi:hypothetical protein